MCSMACWPFSLFLHLRAGQSKHSIHLHSTNSIFDKIFLIELENRISYYVDIELEVIPLPGARDVEIDNISVLIH